MLCQTRRVGATSAVVSAIAGAEVKQRFEIEELVKNKEKRKKKKKRGSSESFQYIPMRFHRNRQDLPGLLAIACRDDWNSKQAEKENEGEYEKNSPAYNQCSRTCILEGFDVECSPFYRKS
jgi:hypothetical protein